MTRSTRLAVYAFIGLVLACGLLSIELWPLSAFKLFSQVRTEHETRWELVVVEGAAERPAPLAAMGRGFRQTLHVLPSLARASAADRDAACDEWLARLDVPTLRVYRSEYLKPAPGRPAVVQERVLRFECHR